MIFVENPHSEELDSVLGYAFNDDSLRDLALTHPSAYHHAQVNTDYERLEFLGDAVLQLTITEFLYHNLPNAPEGLMTQLRARIVGRGNLSQTTLSLGVPAYIRLGKGEELSGGRHRESTLANTFEALLGAIFLDSDFATAKKIALQLLHKSLLDVTSDPRDINPKGELQSELQRLYPEAPIYTTIENVPPTPTRFSSSVHWRGVLLGQGDGNSKRKAEVAAALNALAQKELFLSEKA